MRKAKIRGCAMIHTNRWREGSHITIRQERKLPPNRGEAKYHQAIGKEKMGHKECTKISRSNRQCIGGNKRLHNNAGQKKEERISHLLGWRNLSKPIELWGFLKVKGLGNGRG